jgi:Mg/Co/Ni transporter MgtE
LNEVSSYLASYNLLSVPVVDANERLLGAVTVDDVLDHLLPENWRHDHRDMSKTADVLEHEHLLDAQEGEGK